MLSLQISLILTRENSKIFGLFEEKMNVSKMPIHSTSTISPSTQKPIINVLEANNEELAEIIEEMNNIEMFVFL